MRCTTVVLVSTLALVLGAGCASTPEVVRDESADFDRYRSWDWIPGSPRTIDAPPPYRIGLDRDLARFLERELARRGFVRKGGAPDLHVGSFLRVTRQVVTILETGAMQTLSSLHSSPSYEVQAATPRTEVYERTALLVFAVDSRTGAVVWKGKLGARALAAALPDIEQTVADLLGHFPPAALAPPSPPRRRGLPPPPTEVSCAPAAEAAQSGLEAPSCVAPLSFAR